jgi:hypothetical protein
MSSVGHERSYEFVIASLPRGSLSNLPRLLFTAAAVAGLVLFPAGCAQVREVTSG